MIRAADLSIAFRTRGADVLALDGVSITIPSGQRIGIVGESGSGKSTLALAISGYIKDNGRLLSGSVEVAGVDAFSPAAEQRRHLRGRKIGFVFQNPIGTLDPTRKIGAQFFDYAGARIPAARITGLLDRVGLKDVPRVMASYPHELSGGMAQRVAIAMAIEHEPEILIADEPTSALDASIRIQILDLLLAESRSRNATLVIVSHDLHSVQTYCEQVAVMYAGRIVEHGPTAAVFRTPGHPYTEALLRTVPGKEGFGETIKAIPGNPPSVSGRLEQCAFADRCDRAFAECRSKRPPAHALHDRRVACHLAAARPLADSR